MDKQQLPGQGRPLQRADLPQLNFNTASRLATHLDATLKKGDPPFVGRLGSSKENSKPDETALGKLAYSKDRAPVRSILRKADGSDLQTLQSNLANLETEMQSFKATGRRESLAGRGAIPAPLLPLSLQQQAADAPSAPLRPAPSALPLTQRLQHKPPPASHAGGCHDDDVLGALTGPEVIVKLPVGPLAHTKAAITASAMFEDPSFTGYITEWTTKKLISSTQPNYTDQLRIEQLADICKQLRRIIKMFGSKCTDYIEKCATIEREATEKVENTSLTFESARRNLEAQLASVRSELATMQCDITNERVKRNADLAVQEGEVTRLQSEVARLTEERDAAREKAKRAESERSSLELDIKKLRLTSDQQQREIACNQSEAVRRVNEERTALASLQDKFGHQSERMAGMQAALGAAEELVKMLELKLADTERKMRSKESVASHHEQRSAKLKEELEQTRGALADTSQQVEQLQLDVAGKNRQREELDALIGKQGVELDTMRSRVKAMEVTLMEERHAWERKRQEMEASQVALSNQCTSLTAEVAEAQAALRVMTERTDAAESSARQLVVEMGALQRECTQLQHSVEFCDDRAKQKEQEAAGLRKQVEDHLAEMEANRMLLGEKDARIEQLEGEFTALKEVLGDSTSSDGETGKDIVEKLLHRIAALQTAAAEAEAVRRRLHNDLVDLRGNIRVYCRVKPHPTPATRLGTDGTSIGLAVEGTEHQFRYDRIFGPDSTQEQVFGAVSDLVQSSLDGFHVCVFSYGQTGAGKTHTMQGGGVGASRGIIPRALEKILSTAQKLERDQEWSYTMTASFIEVYNQTLRDLLSHGAEIRDQNAIKRDPNGGHTVVSGAKQVEVTNLDGAIDLLRQAGDARAVVATAMNAESSRSHCVFMLNITGSHASTNTRLQGSLCLVDLAGSERLDRSKAEGDAKREACHINSSLSALGDVFAALAAKMPHVPYRNSKLTYLLQPCLGGSGKTLMFVNVNPEPASAGESLCSLRFAAKVNGCETGAKDGPRRHVQTFGGSGEAGPSGSREPAGSARFSMCIPRLTGGGPDAVSAAAAKRMSMAPVRSAADAVASRTKAATAGRPGSAALGGLKRPGTGLPDVAAKRTKP